MARPQPPSVLALARSADVADLAGQAGATGATVGGQYVLGDKLGAGGMGDVYEALNADGKIVAVKLLRVGPGAPADAHETRSRFAREVEATARLDHKHVLKLLDHGVDDATGAPYFVMPRMHGEDLGQLLTRVHTLAPEVAVPLMVQACRGVAAGHAAGIIHRDLKPSNLFLDIDETEDRVLVRVADFGLAKVQSAGISSLTRSGAMLGTPQYMAPEQAQDAKRVDARSDVYSLGMVLYHALTGRPAFTNSGSYMAFLVGHSGPPHLQKAAPWVPPEIVRVVHAALFRSADARWPNLDELDLGLVMAAGFVAANKPVSPQSLAPIAESAKAILAPTASLPAHWTDLLRT